MGIENYRLDKSPCTEWSFNALKNESKQGKGLKVNQRLFFNAPCSSLFPAGGIYVDSKECKKEQNFIAFY